MRWLIDLAVRLYPAAWRARYDREFLALLEEIGPSWRDLWDIVWEALKMRISMRNPWIARPAFALGGALGLAAVAWFVNPSPYVASATAQFAITYPNQPGGSQEPTEQFLNTELINMLSTAWRQRYAEIFEAPSLQPKVRMEGVFATGSLSARPELVRAGEGSYVLTYQLGYTSWDPAVAREVFADLLEGAADEGGRAVERSPIPVSLRVIGQSAQAPLRMRQNFPALYMVGFLGGLAIWVLTRRRNAAVSVPAGAYLALFASAFLGRYWPHLPVSWMALVFGAAAGYAVSRSDRRRLSPAA